MCYRHEWPIRPCKILDLACYCVLNLSWDVSCTLFTLSICREELVENTHSSKYDLCKRQRKDALSAVYDSTGTSPLSKAAKFRKVDSLPSSLVLISCVVIPPVKKSKILSSSQSGSVCMSSLSTYALTAGGSLYVPSNLCGISCLIMAGDQGSCKAPLCHSAIWPKRTKRISQDVRFISGDLIWQIVTDHVKEANFRP